MKWATKTLFTHKWDADAVSIRFAIHTCCVLVLQLNRLSQLRYGDAELHEAGAGKSCMSYYSSSMSLHWDLLLIAVCCSGYLPSQRYSLHRSIWTGTVVLFCWIKTAVLWDQILLSLHVDPQQKAEISAAVAHCSFFETGLVTVWNGVLRKQNTNGAQKRNSALTVLPSVWSLAILNCRH